jgi:uncharacterized membrane protein
MLGQLARNMSNEHSQIPIQANPQVVAWFKIYSAFLCLLYLAVAAASLFFFLADPADVQMSATMAHLMGALFLLMGLGLFAACLLPLLVSPRPWLWTYDLVIICLGMTSACFLPACIPLLIFWLKPETKRYFGRS